MNYAVYKLSFTTALHIGNDTGSATLSSAEMTIHSDTLFSALCIEALQLGGASMLGKLYELSQNGQVIFSDLFPFYEECYYLPKPVLYMASRPAESDIKQRKEYKNLKYIPAEQFEKYLASLQGQGDFNVNAVNESLAAMGVSGVRQQVSIKGQEETQPYHVGFFKFVDKAGLYLMAAYEDEADLNLLTALLESLGLSGIGGKRTAGLGKFSLDDPIFLDEPYSIGLEALAGLLSDDAAGQRMLLNVALPRDHELEKACRDGTYILLRRGGFVQSDKYRQHQLKKKLLYAFAPGSCFKSIFGGDIHELGSSLDHPVYRYLKPLFMGVGI